MIISIGYRVKSKRGIIFRKWSIKTLTAYLMKGYAIDENRVTLYKENYMELNNTVLKLENRLDKIIDNDKVQDQRLDKLELSNKIIEQT